MMRLGATSSISEDAWFGLSGLRSLWVWGGIVSMVVSLFSWLYALRFVPLNIAFNLAGATQLFVPLGGLLFLHESISAKRWAGILIVMVGVIVVAGAAGEAEEKL